ncbi:MAG: UbiD family decarboxylase [Anaerolineae bacterium]|jgi:UbiD family decarboxylase|nr:UbiD family decarboxylase [Anaerolineae bacterium]
MDLREFMNAANGAGYLLRCEAEVDPYLEIARLALANDGRPMLFDRVKGSPFRVVAGVCSDRRYFGLALGVPAEQVIFRLAEALAQPQEPPVVESGPCREVVMPEVDLEQIPFLTHYAEDGGAYASSAVAFINDPATGRNASYHRLLRLDKRRVAARLVERRGTETSWRNSPDGIPVAICIGLPLHVLLAASMAPAPGVDEMAVAQALAPTPMVELANGVRVPADAEFALEGRITKTLTDEGPFVDLTGTYDFIRQQPVIEIDRVTHRRDAIYHALLPGRLEHKLLMGMPKEPTILAEVNKVTRGLNVNITPGGASWLHAVVQISKDAPDAGKQAIAAAFRGHGSLKHVWVVDEDINPFDPNDVEWAVATRFQADRGLVVLDNQPSSSLDPSAHHAPGQKSRTAKMGIDATVHWDTPAGPREPDAYRRIG